LPLKGSVIPSSGEFVPPDLSRSQNAGVFTIVERNRCKGATTIFCVGNCPQDQQVDGDDYNAYDNETTRANNYLFHRELPPHVLCIGSQMHNKKALLNPANHMRLARVCKVKEGPKT
jgi:hypothetical protein